MARRIPTLCIVGRPNVGKSTLFNRLVGRRIAVIDDQPGVTRDRLYAEGKFGNYTFRVVDTGGILFGDEDPLVEQIRVQAEVAMTEADVVLFMVDTESGLVAADWALADRLRGFRRPVYVVANKTDNPQRVAMAQEFYELGLGPVFTISSIHGAGVDELLTDIFQGFPKQSADEGEEKGELRLAIIGRPNVGKSSLLNAFTGEKRAIVSDIPGTTRDTVDTVVQWKGEPVRLIDTAGIRRRGKTQGSIEYYMVLRAQNALERAECALCIVDGVEGVTDGDKRVMKLAHDAGKALVVVVNKWDLREPPTGDLGKNTPLKKDFRRALFNEMPEVSYAAIRFTSAKEESGLEGVMNAVLSSVENWSFRISTGVLNRLIQEATFDKPLSRKGRPVKVKYVTQAETRPPTFIMFCNDPDLVHFSYIRYLENCIRKEFPLEGTPIRLIARAGKERD